MQNADIEADCTHNGWPVKKQKREWGENREKEKRERKRDEQEQEKMFFLERALYQVQRKKIIFKTFRKMCFASMS